MTAVEITLRQELRQLARDQAQLQFAFHELGVFLGAALTGRAMLDPEYVIAILDQLSADAGNKLAVNSGEEAVPNPYLKHIAHEVRKICDLNSSDLEKIEHEIGPHPA